jgi:hypothetical protein
MSDDKPDCELLLEQFNKCMFLNNNINMRQIDVFFTYCQKEHKKYIDSCIYYITKN